jgi:hypothetical protein
MNHIQQTKERFKNFSEGFVYYSSYLVGNQKKRLLALLPLIAPVYISAQNVNVSGNIQSVPSMTNAYSGIHMKNVLTDQSYSAFTDSLGNFSQNIPAGKYFRMIQTIDHRRFEDTIDVKSDTVLNEQMVKPRKAISTYFTDDLDVVNCLLGVYGSPGGETIRWSDSNVPIRFSTDSAFPMPTGTPHRERLDTALTDLLAKSHGSAKFREAVGDSVVNVLFQYKPRSQIPLGGSGWTVTDNRFPDMTPMHMTVLIATDQPYVSVGTFARELARVLELYNTVPDRNFVMFIDGAAQRFHPDEGNAIELIYRLKVHTDTRKYKNFVDTALTNIKDILDNNPKDFNLYQNYPNPFNASTIIKYELKNSSNVKLEVYDNLGRLVETLVDEKKEVGKHEVEFKGMRYASGIYHYRLTEINNESREYNQQRGKMSLIK